MKKIFAILLTSVLLLMLIGCERTADEDTPDSTGDEVTVKESDENVPDSKDGETAVKEITYDWPKDKLPKYVPKLKKITITDITEDTSGITIVFRGLDETMTKKYINDIKKEDWDIEIVNSETEKVVTATKGQESLIFTESIDGTGSIVYSAG